MLSSASSSNWVEHSAHFDSSEEFARVDILFQTINAKFRNANDLELFTTKVLSQLLARGQILSMK